MNRFSSTFGPALILCLALSSTAAVAADARLEQALAQGGLQKVTVKGIDLAFARPGVKLSGYNKFITNVDVEKTSFNGNARLGYSGLQLFATGTF